MGKSVKKAMLIALLSVFVLSIGAATTAVAYWIGTSKLSQENTLSIGQDEISVVLGDSVGNNPTEWYEGTAATFTFDVAIDNTEGVTVEAYMDSASAADFDVDLYINDIAAANDGTDAVVNEDEVTVNVTFNATAKPVYTTATLTVKLNVA